MQKSPPDLIVEVIVNTIDQSMDRSTNWISEEKQMLFCSLLLSFQRTVFSPQANFLNENPPNFVYNECMLVKKDVFFHNRETQFCTPQPPPTQNVHKIWRKKNLFDNPPTEQTYSKRKFWKITFWHIYLFQRLPFSFAPFKLF